MDYVKFNENSCFVFRIVIIIYIIYRPEIVRQFVMSCVLLQQAMGARV